MADQDVDTLADLFKDFHPDSRSNLEFMTTLRGVIQYSPMMVAAHPSDLRAAKAAGFHTACVPRPGERGEGYDPTCCPSPTLM
jgi:2-haloacid dehalogenase